MLNFSVGSEGLLISVIVFDPGLGSNSVDQHGGLFGWVGCGCAAIVDGWDDGVFGLFLHCCSGDVPPSFGVEMVGVE